jgi:hypothetical protein
MIKPIEDWLTLDEHGIQMPWYTRPFLEILDTWDLKGKNVFEYGAGHSTLWYRSRGALVFSVDSDAEWANMSDAYYTNDKDLYLRSSLSCWGKKFDIVAIDGDYRDDCTEYALEALKPGGILIIDNWDQPSVEPNEWSKTCDLIKGMTMAVHKEPGHPDWKTAVIIKPWI